MAASRQRFHLRYNLLILQNWEYLFNGKFTVGAVYDRPRSCGETSPAVIDRRYSEHKISQSPTSSAALVAVPPRLLCPRQSPIPLPPLKPVQAPRKSVLRYGRTPDRCRPG